MNLVHTPAHTTTTPDYFQDPVTERGYTVCHDLDAEDPRTCIENEHVALWAFNEPRLRNSTAATKPEGNVAIDAFARYWEASSEEEAALAMTRRYLAIFHPEDEFEIETNHITGYSQGDWLDVVAASKKGYGLPEGHIEDFRRWAFGDIWIVIPDDGPGISNIAADDAEEAVAFFRKHHEDTHLVRTITLTIRTDSEDDADAQMHRIIDGINEGNAINKVIVAKQTGEDD